MLRLFTRISLSVLLAALLLPAASSASTLVVDVNGGGDFLSIKTALAFAAGIDTLLIMPGEYTGAGNRGINPGGWDYTYISAAGPESTVINCEYEDRAFVFGSGVDSTYVIGLTIKHGQVVDSEPGGAVVCSGSSPVFVDCVFQGNGSNAGGGAVQCFNAAPTFEDCVFVNNGAVYGGAVISKGDSHPILNGVVFDNNNGASTGGMRCEGGGATLTNVTFLDNDSGTSAGGFGGFGAGAYSISNSVFAGNVAGWGGGGVACGNADLSIENCTFVRNTAAWGSAVATTAACSLSITASILSFGSPPEVVACVDATPSVTHCCVYGNAGGDSLCGDYHDNTFLNPMFCDGPARDYTLYDASPCLPENNPWGVQMGAFGEGCTYPGAPPSPANLTAVAHQDTAVVSWSPVVVSTFHHYRLDRDVSSLFGPETVELTTADTVVIDAPLLDGVRYYYRVVAVDTFDVESAPSDTVSCLILPVPPAIPVDVVAVAGDEMVDVSWRENVEHDFDHYAVYRDTSSGFTPVTPFALSASAALSDSTVSNYFSYYYRVAAVDTSGLASEASGEVRAVPHGVPPAVVGLEATPADTSVFLTWRAVAPPFRDYYKVYRDTTPDMISLAVFYDGFEMYEPDAPPPDPPWSVIAQTGTAVRVTDGQQVVGERSVALKDSSSGYLRFFASLGDSGSAAPRVRFQVRPGAQRSETNLVQFEIFTEAGVGYPAGVLEVCDGQLRQWVAGSDPETLAQCAAETWHDVQWYLDCVADTYGVWLDGERLVGGAPFFNDGETLTIIQVRTRNLEWGEAWVDELFVGGHVERITATPDTSFLDQPLETGTKYYYKVTVVDTFGAESPPSELVAVVPGWVGVDDEEENGAIVAFVWPGIPNPFSGATSLRYGVPAPGADVRVRVYDVSGRLVKTLVDERQEGGVYGLAWDGRNENGSAVASGVYFVRAAIGDWSGTRKVAVVR